MPYLIRACTMSWYSDETAPILAKRAVFDRKFVLLRTGVNHLVIPRVDQGLSDPESRLPNLVLDITADYLGGVRRRAGQPGPPDLLVDRGRRVVRRPLARGVRRVPRRHLGRHRPRPHVVVPGPRQHPGHRGAFDAGEVLAHAGVRPEQEARVADLAAAIIWILKSPPGVCRVCTCMRAD